MTTAILWLRRDLRLGDNPALVRALATCEQVVPVFVHAPEEEGDWYPGGASRWWLHHSLAALDRTLRSRGARLVLRRGPSLDALRRLAVETGATHVFWNRLYEPATIARDRTIKQALREDGLSVESHKGSLLFEPWEVRKGDDGPFRVFTPFWKACLRAGFPGGIEPAPRALPPVPAGIGSLALEELGLRPKIPWDSGLAETWEVGEEGAQRALHRFLEGAVGRYDQDRNRPDLTGTSRLSPYLHFGEIGPRQVVVLTGEVLRAQGIESPLKGRDVFFSEIGWREFAHHLLYHFPHTSERPMDIRFEGFPWAEDYVGALAAWQRGRTGIPVVDAGMRELWHTGWMHNRVRMVVASLLTKNLLIPWQEGARWFWDTLVDADLASNSLGWQWTAGCGADAAPYFRIFNPVLQGEKFDPAGSYVRRWVPHLARLPDRYLHRPWEAPGEVRRAAGIAPDSPYAAPLVDLKATRERALERFDRIKHSSRRALTMDGQAVEIGNG
jgi:deoxyribodipyrimidine photo-lyase